MRITVRLPLDLWRDSAQLARGRGQTLSELVRDALDRERYIDGRDRYAEIVGRQPKHLEALRHEVGMLDASPTTEAAIRSEAIRRRQKRAHHGRQKSKGAKR